MNINNMIKQKLQIIIVCLFVLLASCSAGKKKDHEETSIGNNTEPPTNEVENILEGEQNVGKDNENQDNVKTIQAPSLYNEWCSLSTLNNRLVLSENGIFENSYDLYGSVMTGTFLIGEDFIEFYYEYDNGMKQTIKNDYSFVNNILQLGFDLYYVVGEIPYFDNVYSAKLAGYYKDDFDAYYYFGSNGKLECIQTSGIDYNYFYVADERQYVGVIGGQDSEAYTRYDYLITNDCIELCLHDSDKPFNHLWSVESAEFEERKKSIDRMYTTEGQLLIIADAIKIRYSPSLSGEIKGTVKKGDKIPYVGITQESEGYKWYNIGKCSYNTNEECWIADKDGEWIYELR